MIRRPAQHSTQRTGAWGAEVSAEALTTIERRPKARAGANARLAIGWFRRVRILA